MGSNYDHEELHVLPPYTTFWLVYMAAVASFNYILICLKFHLLMQLYHLF